jgi:hypothetical protein
MDMPERAAFPNHRHDEKRHTSNDPVTGRSMVSTGTTLARLRLLTVAGAVRALRTLVFQTRTLFSFNPATETHPAARDTRCLRFDRHGANTVAIEPWIVVSKGGAWKACGKPKEMPS